MKRKILSLLFTAVLFICVLAISASAEEIKKFENNEFQSGDNITYLEGINDDMYYTQDKYGSFYDLVDESYVARAVVQNSDGTYTTYPSWYFMSYEHYWNGAEYRYIVDRINELSSVTGETYTKSSIVKFEFPEYKKNHGFSIKTNPGALGMGNVEYVRLATHFISTGGAFQGTAIKVVEYPENHSITEMGARTFLNCYQIEEIIIPNTVTTINYECIQFWNGPVANAKLKVINLGASLTTLSGKNPINGANVPGLIIYAPETLDGATYGASYFPSTAVVIFTGNKEQAEAFGFASTISYAEYEANGCVADAGTMVYGYSKCEAFYGGAHVFGEATYTYESHVKGAKMVAECETCGAKKVVQEFNPIITFQGFSAKINGSAVTVGYTINKEALEKYESEGNALSYGMVAYVPSIEQAHSYAPLKIGENGVEAIDAQRTVNVNVDEEYASVNFIIKGFTDAPVSIIMCMYAYDGSSISYLCGTTENDVEQLESAYAVKISMSNGLIERCIAPELE